MDNSIVGRIKQRIKRTRDERAADSAPLSAYFSWEAICKDFKRNKWIYLMALPVLGFICFSIIGLCTVQQSHLEILCLSVG